MSQQPTRGAAQAPSSAMRAEQLMDNWGHQVGLFIGMTRQRLQNAVTSIREEADRMDQPRHIPSQENGARSSTTQLSSKRQGRGAGEPVTQRAELMVDGFAQQVGTLAASTGLQIRRTGAFLREDAEDIWAEAQSLREQWKDASVHQNNPPHQ